MEVCRCLPNPTASWLIAISDADFGSANSVAIAWGFGKPSWMDYCPPPVYLPAAWVPDEGADKIDYFLCAEFLWDENDTGPATVMVGRAPAPDCRAIYHITETRRSGKQIDFVCDYEGAPYVWRPLSIITV